MKHLTQIRPIIALSSPPRRARALGLVLSLQTLNTTTIRPSHKDASAFYREIISTPLVFPGDWTDLSPPGDHVVVPVVPVPADQSQLLPLSDVVGPQQGITDKS